MSEDDEYVWPPALLASGFRTAGEQALEGQEAFLRWLASASRGGGLGDAADLGAMSRRTATFKTRVQSGGRISIPDAEREALGIEDGDIVQTIVIPLDRVERDSNGK